MKLEDDIALKEEITKVFKRHRLRLELLEDFVVFDRNYYNGDVSWERSDIRRFTYLIGASREYKYFYDVEPVELHAAIGIKRINNKK